MICVIAGSAKAGPAFVASPDGYGGILLYQVAPLADGTCPANAQTLISASDVIWPVPPLTINNAEVIGFSILAVWAVAFGFRAIGSLFNREPGDSNE